MPVIIENYGINILFINNEMNRSVARWDPYDYRSKDEPILLLDHRLFSFETIDGENVTVNIDSVASFKFTPIREEKQNAKTQKSETE